MTEKSKRVLIVDDERPLARALELKLKSENIETDVAYDGEAALEAIKSNSYALVLLDIVMPKMNGIQVINALKGVPGPPKIIVLSNLGHEDEIQRAKDLGVKDFFIKSNIAIAKLVTHIKEELKD